jgi:WbqC-like protein family
MIISTNQPYFAPYPGFFYKAHLSDYFVILDDVQFPRKTTWISRNRFKNDQGTLWMTIPVLKKGLGLQKISEIRICHAGNWKKKHLRSLQSAYAHAPFFRDHLKLMERVLSLQYDDLLGLNLDIITYILDYLKIETRIVLMSELGVSGKGAPLTIDICKSLGATQFLVQSSAQAYYAPSIFDSVGIELVAFKKPEFIYPQMWGDFIANLSILDMIFTCGAKVRDIVFYKDLSTSC